MNKTQLQPPQVIGMLAHPIRWRVVKALSVSDRRVRELVETLGEPYNLVSYHLKLLRQANMVELRKSDADSRDLYYSLNMDKLQDNYQKVARAINPGWTLKEADQVSVHIPPRRVLFLCTHNSARSQIAEGILRHLGGVNYLVASAGNLPQPIHPETLAVMKEFGVNVSNQYSKHITDLQDQSFDEVITVCDRVREACPTYEFCIPTIHWSIPDPAEISDPVERRIAFAQTAQEIERRIRQFMLYD
jgi:protein-tyrosine-phosphatase